ncbi:DNA polymerase (family 10) [Natronoarchaeum philippinense]|uniref:DNA polymerase beta n=1 Tax=Natronoarchaeum philippinense TaxID=558529 RepID=A0A285NVT0_NATPI|nr:DNA polymerase/3'-5' exonuclease PolX [Natronoarchaeum philippinense]SNZ13033.1 DNA polymerase (family 10) [Natronoarchaeum philippinense]
MTNDDAVAGALEEMADLLEANDVEYKPRAYRRAAENIRDHPASVTDLAADDPAQLDEIDGVGDAIAEKIVEYVETDTIGELEDLRQELPVEMEALTRVEGVGPKTVGTLYRALGVRTLTDLDRAAREEKIREVSGFGAKTEQNIAENIEFAKSARERELLGDGRPLADALLSHLSEHETVERCEVAGSIRRWKDTVGDVDVLAASEDSEAVVEAFTDWERVEDVIEAGTHKASVRAGGGVRLDLRVVVPDEFGSALQYFTGSKDHNVALRNYALDRDVKLNEYGAFDISEVGDPDADQRVGERIGGTTEESMYEALGLPRMPPEIRQGTGEIEAAAENDLPDLLGEDDVRGDLHTHSDWSDGGYQIEEMIAAAADVGHEYLAVTDHASGPGIFGNTGLDDEELLEQIDAVREVAADHDIEVLTGVETNVDADGELSTGDDVLDELDLVVASPHSALDADGDAGTDRLIAAVEHPAVDVLGHPHGRLLNQRSGLDLDVPDLAAAAADADTALEVNSNPARLDLWGRPVRAAIEAGAPIAIDTDAHSPGEFEHVRYGVHTARRGWAEPADVLNAWSIDDLREFLH